MKFYTYLIKLLIFFSVTGSALSAVNIEIVRFKNMEDEDFAHIKEFFNGIEDQSFRAVFRTEPTQRDGFYFIIKMDKKIRDLNPNTQLQLEWIPYGELKPNVATFSLHSKASGSEIYLGLTGDDAPKGKINAPLAWRISLSEPNNKLLSVKQSFLWQ